ncbi:hypothetical protein KR026_012086, partial [Drosophila bipectinata]
KMHIESQPVMYSNREHQGESISLGQYGQYGSNLESGEQPKGFGFSNDSIRRGFIRKVYLILLGQLVTSLAIISIMVFNTEFQYAVARNPWVLMISFIMTIAILVILVCNEDLRRQTPANFVLLVCFTIAQSFLLGSAACHYAPKEVFTAVLITTAVCLGLTLFALQTKYDFTMLGGILVASVIILIFFGIVTMFAGGGLASTIYASISAVVFSVYLIYDTQLMMGGNHRYSISPEEYIFSALNLYIDVVNIFMDILRLIGGSD